VSLVRPLARPLRWLASRRLRQLEAVWRNLLEAQERALHALVRRACDTAWGREHGYGDIRRVTSTRCPGPAINAR
jgi:hypothetical protein